MVVVKRPPSPDYGTEVDVGEKVSIGLVTLSVQEMGVGDLVMMQKAD